MPTTKNSFVSISPSVNITEDDEGYRIDVAAPGVKKDKFSIEINDSVLVIKTDQEKTDSELTGKSLRKEFNYQTFKRQFHLSEDISKNDIQATFSNGILSVRLLKKEETKIVNRTIEIL